MRERRRLNPFYVLLVPVGVAFVVTAFAYCVMAFQSASAAKIIATSADDTQDDAETAGSHALTQWMRIHGDVAMLAELAVLGVLTAAAIGFDQLLDRPPPSQAPGALSDEGDAKINRDEN